MSVNVSTRQLADPDFPGDVRAAVDAAGIDPTRLTLEITEHLLLDDGELMQQRLQALKEIGVRLAIDDFGTGYSALSYLQTFPVDVLKIDRSFVSGIDHDPERARLVRGIVEMGHNLRLSVVSEGIEEAGEAALMREFRSQYGQGYLFSKPVDAATLDRLLADDTTLDGGRMITRTLTVAALAAAGLGLGAAQAQAAQRFDISGQVNAPDNSGATLRQSGPFSGTPLGAGTVNVTTKVGAGKGARVSFKMFNRRGQIWGTGDVKLTFRGSKVSYSGTARITGGSGAFSRMRGSGLRLTGGGDMTGSRFPLRLTGSVSA